MPPVSSMVAEALVPATADIAALVRAAGGDLTRSRYDSGTGKLTVIGITQSDLDAVLDLADPLFASRFRIKQAAAKELVDRTNAGMPWLGKVVQIDETSTGRMTAVAFGMQLGAANSVSWRMSDNTPLVLDKPGMTTMAISAMGYVLALRGRYWAIVDGAKAATDEAALEAINPQAGWPAAPASPSA